MNHSSCLNGVERKGLSLVEALILVATVGFLVAVAGSLYVEAWHRSKTAQARNNMQSIVQALESYSADHGGKYPLDGIDDYTYYGSSRASFGTARLNNMFTTPIAYLEAEQMRDPFINSAIPQARIYRYVNFDTTYRDSSISARQGLYPQYAAVYGSWVVQSAGPNRRSDVSQPNSPFWVALVYDPTNGTLSAGDIVRSHRQQTETGH